MLEIRVRVKNESHSSTYKDLLYDFDPMEIPSVKNFIDTSVKSFGEDPEKVSYSLHQAIQ